MRYAGVYTSLCLCERNSNVAPKRHVRFISLLSSLKLQSRISYLASRNHLESSSLARRHVYAVGTRAVLMGLWMSQADVHIRICVYVYIRLIHSQITSDRCFCPKAPCQVVCVKFSNDQTQSRHLRPSRKNYQWLVIVREKRRNSQKIGAHLRYSHKYRRFGILWLRDCHLLNRNPPFSFRAIELHCRVVITYMYNGH